jgi:xylan 1,4-beta-xylosidase
MRKWLFLLVAILLLLPPIVGGCGNKEQPSAKEYSLTVAVIGNGTTAPAPGTYNYNEGDWVTVTAIPDYGWKFDQWSGDASGNNVTTVIHMDGDKNVIASFSLSGES